MLQRCQVISGSTYAGGLAWLHRCYFLVSSRPAYDWYLKTLLSSWLPAGSAAHRRRQEVRTLRRRR